MTQSPIQVVLGPPPSRPAPSFAVPLARALDGSEIRPDDASAGTYTCVDCGRAVSFRRAHERDGYPVSAHFAHHANAACGFSEGEGEQHLRAKQRVAELVAQRTPVKLIRHCRRCDLAHVQQIPERVVRASLERALVSGRRADVALLDAEGSVLAVIEVLETHEVDQDKRIDLAGVRWCEIRASTILAGEEWALVQDELLPYTCRRCRDTVTRPFTGPTRLEVDCPLPGAGAVTAVNTCAPCAFFLKATEAGITCWGAPAR